jgi:caffeoyl-CoA O-methyltransferase
MGEFTSAPHSLRPVTPAGLVASSLAEALESAELLDRVCGEHGILGELLDSLRRAAGIAGGLEPYLERCTTPASPDLAGLAERTREHDWQAASDIAPAALEAEMLSGHVEGRLLQFLVAMSGARRVLEIGMFTGYAALAIAEALDDDGRLITCEIDPGVAAFAQSAFDGSLHGAKIDVRVGPADVTLGELADRGEQFDLVFIDADKPGYLGYVNTLLERRLLAPTGTICVDNTLMQGEPWLDTVPSVNGAAISAFNDAIAADSRVEQVLIPLRDGVSLIRWCRG